MSVSFYIMADGQILHEPYKTVIDGEEFEENKLEVNMHSAGASSVAHTLGFCIDWSSGGEIPDLDALIRQCDSTLALIRDMPEMDAYDERGHVITGDNPIGAVLRTLGCARTIACPRPEGYLKRNVTAIRTLALRAKECGGRLVYA